MMCDFADISHTVFHRYVAFWVGTLGGALAVFALGEAPRICLFICVFSTCVFVLHIQEQGRALWEVPRHWSCTLGGAGP